MGPPGPAPCSIGGTGPKPGMRGPPKAEQYATRRATGSPTTLWRLCAEGRHLKNERATDEALPSAARSTASGEGDARR